ncbi:MAG TPA: hypothetical protein VES60_06430 [Nakamurella sp.]|nr:hypothetical protein [Nakamurella sp.]
MADCLLCDPAAADAAFDRVRLWENNLWRLSAVLRGPIPGFAHLEPRRHIPYVTDLDGPEAATFGAVLARVTEALRMAADAEKTYVYAFGDHVPHFHVNLAPHRAGDALRGGPGLARSRRRRRGPGGPSGRRGSCASRARHAVRARDSRPKTTPARPPRTESGPVVLSGR